MDRAPPPRRGPGRAGGRPRAGHRAIPGRVAAARARAGPHARAPRAATRCWSRRATRAPALERWYRRRRRRRSAPRLDAATRARRLALHGADDPRAADALGVLLVDGRDVVQLAAAARAAGDPRLRRRARGLPPRGDGPLAALLAAARVALAATGARTRRGCAATGRRSRSERSASYGSSPVERRAEHAARSTRRAPPSPRTSSPARPARSLELDPDRDQVLRLVAAADRLDGIAAARATDVALGDLDRLVRATRSARASTFGPRRTVTR